MTRSSGVDMPVGRPVYLALLAGGSGTRFWPLSRSGMPKQFLRLGGGKSLLQETRERYAPLVPGDRTLVVASSRYRDLIREQIPEIPDENLVLEPSPRDTAPAVGLAALEVRRREPRAVLVISPSDHRVADPQAFRETLRRALSSADAGGLGTLGVVPERPAVSFGYLRLSGESGPRGVRRVERFVEKPDAATAKRYLAEGNYLWNAGIFLFRLDVFFKELGRAAPQLVVSLEALDRARSAGDGESVRAVWESLPATSIDYALMEKAFGVWTVPLSAGWDDVGSWLAVEKALERDSAGNAAAGAEAVFVQASGCTVFGDELSGGRRKTAVLVGVQDIIVVPTEDIVLVCRRDRVEEVRKAVEELRRRGRADLL